MEQVREYLRDGRCRLANGSARCDPKACQFYTEAQGGLRELKAHLFPSRAFAKLLFKDLPCL